jgi:hypothetical protein
MVRTGHVPLENATDNRSARKRNRKTRPRVRGSKIRSFTHKQSKELPSNALPMYNQKFAVKPPKTHSAPIPEGKLLQPQPVTTSFSTRHSASHHSSGQVKMAKGSVEFGGEGGTLSTSRLDESRSRSHAQQKAQKQLQEPI